jgi:hypothetical protein
MIIWTFRYNRVLNKVIEVTMHSNNEPKPKCGLQLIELISKIRRLRTRLISCGYSHK